MRGARWSAVLALALAACSVGPPYERPALDIPADFRGAAGNAEAGAALGELAWWEIFGDPLLRRLMETALARNRDLGIAAARIAEANALVGQARTAQWPQLGVNVGAQRGRIVQSGGYVTGGLFTGTLGFSHEIDLWRRLASQTEIARANLLATQAGHDAIETALLGSVATAYFTLLTLDRQTAIATQTIANRQRFVDLTHKLAERGAASALEFDRAEASLAQVRALLPDLQRQTAQTENQLQVLLGRNPAAVIRAPAAEQPLPLLPEVPLGLPSSLLERRPDLIAAEAALAGATAGVNGAKALLFPAITLTGSYGSESFALSKLFSGPSKIWTVGLDLLQPLVDAQRNGHAVDAAQARRQQALLHYQNAVAQAFREVADALAARRAYGDTVAAQSRQVAALRNAQGHVLRRYELGRSSYFEVIDADAALLSAELQLLQAQRAGLVASIQLYQALGGGWSPDRIAARPTRRVDAPP